MLKMHLVWYTTRFRYSYFSKLYPFGGLLEKKHRLNLPIYKYMGQNGLWNMFKWVGIKIWVFGRNTFFCKHYIISIKIYILIKCVRRFSMHLNKLFDFQSFWPVVGGNITQIDTFISGSNLPPLLVRFIHN